MPSVASVHMPTPPGTAEVLAQGRDNNFNLIRMVAASAVILSHSFPLALGHSASEPLAGWMAPLDLGKAAVRVFFAISGFFILKSFDRRNSTVEFAIARVARIVPGLAAVTMATSILTAVGITWAANPYPLPVNGPLWTLWFEATCYLCLALAGLAGLYRCGRFPAFLMAFAMVWAAIVLRILPVNPAYASLGLPFVFGMTVYQYREHVPLNGPVALGLTALALSLGTDALWSIALGYDALWVGSLPSPLLRYNDRGDFSYGTYIFGWPIQQLIVLSFVGIGPMALMSLALPITWALGILSWRFVEYPAMEAAKTVGRRLRSRASIA